MCIEAILLGYITHAEQIQLPLLTVTGCVDWEQHRPRDEAADKTHGRCDFQIPKEKIAVEGLVVQDIAIRNFGKSSHPIEESSW